MILLIVRYHRAESAPAFGRQTQPNQPRPRTLVPTRGPHGRIGVVVKTGAAPSTDSIGAWIEAVTPGGPAAKAGLKAGDVITKFNGTALAGLAAPEENASGPGRKLVTLARGLAPGDTAPIEYRRGSDSKKTRIVTEDVGSWMVIVDPVEPVGPGIVQVPGGGDPGFPSFCFGDVLVRHGARQPSHRSWVTTSAPKRACWW